MAYRLRFFAEPRISNIKTIYEAAFMELCIGIICSVLAYACYEVFIQLFIACVIIAIVCLALTIYNVVELSRSH